MNKYNFIIKLRKSIEDELKEIDLQIKKVAIKSDTDTEYTDIQVEEEIEDIIKRVKKSI